MAHKPELLNKGDSSNLERKTNPRTRNREIAAYTAKPSRLLDKSIDLLQHEEYLT